MVGTVAGPPPRQSPGGWCWTTCPCPGFWGPELLGPQGRAWPREGSVDRGTWRPLPRWTPCPSTKPASKTPAPATPAGIASASAPPWPLTPSSAPRRAPACSGGPPTCAVSARLPWPPGPRGAGWELLSGGRGCCSGRGVSVAPSPPPPSPSLTAPLPPAIFCDYYNPPGECEWHYEPCGNRSFETCRTVNGIHSNISVSYLEGERPRGVLP